MGAAFWAERHAGRRPCKHKLRPRVDAVDQCVEPAAHERVVDSADRQQELAVHLMTEAELTEQHEQVHLANAELDVLPAGIGLPTQQPRHRRRGRLPRIFGPHAGTIDPATQIGRDRHVRAGGHDALC